MDRTHLEDDVDLDEAIHQAVDRRKRLLSRVLQQWRPVLFNDEMDEDDDSMM